MFAAPFEGHGYVGIAVALVARLRPWRVVVAAIGFALIETAVKVAQPDPDLALPDGFERVVEAALVIGFLVFDAPRIRTWFARVRARPQAERSA